VKTVLASQQLFAELAVLLGHLAHHGVELADQFGQGL
jgi:hypothetical protein